MTIRKNKEFWKGAHANILGRASFQEKRSGKRHILRGRRLHKVRADLLPVILGSKSLPGVTLMILPRKGTVWASGWLCWTWQALLAGGLP